MISKTKLIAAMSMSALLLGGGIAAVSGKTNFVKAEGLTRKYDIVSLIAAKMTSEDDQEVEIEYQGATFKYQLHNVAKSGNSLIIDNGYLYNLTALNGLSSVEVSGTKSEGSNYSQIFGKTTTSITDEEYVNSLSNTRVNTFQKHDNTYGGTNFSILASDDSVTINKIEVCYTCITGSSELKKTDELEFDRNFKVNTSSDSSKIINIHNDAEYVVFAEWIVNENNCQVEQDYVVNLLDDISVDRPYFKSTYSFFGEFNGNNNTVTINYDLDDSEYSGQDYATGFLPPIVDGAYVHDLNITGSILNGEDKVGLLTSAIEFEFNNGLSSEIRNICISNGKVSGTNYVGLLSGNCNEYRTSDYPNTTHNVHSIKVSGEVDGENYVGGIVGESRVRISKVKSETEVIGNENVGGISGLAQSDIANSIVSNSKINGYSNVGGVVGKTEKNKFNDNICKVENCESDGNTIVKGTTCVGGIAGYGYSYMENCSNSASVSGASYVGGIVGFGIAGATGCKNFGSVSASSTYCGGIVGYGNFLISSCVNRGNISISSSYCGGIVGYTEKKISNCNNFGNITLTGADKKNYGGIVGYSTSEINGCYSEGKISGSNTFSNVGGIVGNKTSSGVSQCNSKMEIDVPSSKYIGGITGQSTAPVDGCEFAGSINAASYAGGIIGYANGSTVIVSNCISYKDCVVGTAAANKGSSTTYKGWLVGRLYNESSFGDGNVVGNQKSDSTL